MPMPGQLKSVLRDGTAGHQGHRTPTLMLTLCGGGMSSNSKSKAFNFASNRGMMMIEKIQEYNNVIISLCHHETNGPHMI